MHHQFWDIYLTSQLRQDMAQGLFYVRSLYMYIWAKDKNYPVPATSVTLALILHQSPPLLMQWERFCCRVRISRTRHLLPSKMRREDTLLWCQSKEILELWKYHSMYSYKSFQHYSRDELIFSFIDFRTHDREIDQYATLSYIFFFNQISTRK